MKQIDEALNRFFDGRKQLKQKWVAIKQIEDSNEFLVLYHYQHLILKIDLKDLSVKYKWYECPTDKRGLDAAIEYINNKKNNI
jgi:hypothetical protein